MKNFMLISLSLIAMTFGINAFTEGTGDDDESTANENSINLDDQAQRQFLFGILDSIFGKKKTSSETAEENRLDPAALNLDDQATQQFLFGILDSIFGKNKKAPTTEEE